MLPYQEGTAFFVPLRKGGFARGVAARVSPQGRGVFGYFFGPRLKTDTHDDLTGLQPGKEILRLMFGDLGLANKEWKIIGQIPNWNRGNWPMPDFVQRDPFVSKKLLLIRYSDTDPMRIETTYEVQDDTGLLPNLSSGYGAVEIKLTNILCK